jgi:transposase InsO family protein
MSGWPASSAACASAISNWHWAIHVAASERSAFTSRISGYADRGSAMTSKSLALLLADLGVVKTHSRPHVSDDNPFSEAHFKTLKYHPLRTYAEHKFHPF